MTGGPPAFIVPDVEPMHLGEDPADDLAAGGAPPELTVLPGGAGSLTVAQVRELVEMPFAVAALRRGAHWKLTRDEGELVAEPLTRILNSYSLAARALSTVGGPVTVAGALTLLITARLLEDADHATDPAGPGPRRRGTGGPGVAADDDARARGVRSAGARGDLRGGDRLDAERPRGGTLNGGFVIPGGSSDAADDPVLYAADPWDVPGAIG